MAKAVCKVAELVTLSKNRGLMFICDPLRPVAEVCV
jgi:hypothetical protein